MRGFLYAVAEVPTPRDYVTLGGQILIAMIGALALIIVGWFQFVYRPRTKKQNGLLERVRDQVENSHETNLRDDLDGIAITVRTLAESVARLHESTATVHNEITTVRIDTAGLHRAIAGLRTEITEIRGR